MQIRSAMNTETKPYMIGYVKTDKEQTKALMQLVDEFIDHEDKTNTAERVLSRGTVKLLKVGDEYVGFLIYIHNSHKNLYHISAICIGKAYRHKGYGEALLLAFIAKHDNVFIGVRSENTAALSLYKKVGFKVIQTGNEEGMNFTLLNYRGDPKK